MMKDLKKNIILFCCLGLFSACSTTVIDRPDTGNAIKFVSTTTRAAIENDFPDGSSFSVWGWYINLEGARNDVFTETPVTKNGNEWGYEGTQFWIQDNTYNFYAIYPVGAGTVEQDGTIKVENFDCSETGDGAVDLMTAARQNMNGSSSQIVNLKFKHLLSRLQFVLKADEATQNIVGNINLTNAKLYGLYSKASYYGSFISTDDENINGSWSVEGNIGTNEKPNYSHQSKTQVTVDGINLFSDELLVIPSFLNDNVILEISYTIGSVSTTKYFNIGFTQVAEWEAGKSYRYSMTIIDEDHILFDKPSVNPWTSATGGIIIVE